LINNRCVLLMQASPYCWVFVMSPCPILLITYERVFAKTFDTEKQLIHILKF
jgi:hypothetical protein